MKPIGRLGTFIHELKLVANSGAARSRLKLVARSKLKLVARRGLRLTRAELKVEARSDFSTPG